MSIRSTAKAIILHNRKILLNRCYDRHNGDYFTLPGGGQNQYETLEDAIIRECREETGYTVIPLRFAALCEEICDDEEFRQQRPEYAHKMLHIFVCSLCDETRAAPTETDDMQVECVWLDLEELPAIRLLPEALGANITDLIQSDRPLFLGSAHIPFNHG